MSIEKSRKQWEWVITFGGGCMALITAFLVPAAAPEFDLQLPEWLQVAILFLSAFAFAFSGFQLKSSGLNSLLAMTVMAVVESVAIAVVIFAFFAVFFS